MKRMTLGQRIAAVACLVLLTISIALFYFIQVGFSKDIAFAVLEQSGNKYQRPLEDLLHFIPEHQLLVRRSTKVAGGLQGQIDDVEAKVDASLQDLHDVDARLGKSLEFTPEGLAKRKRENAHWQTLQSEWAALKGATGRTPAESDTLHERMTATVRTMIAHAGDTSNLILDSDLDSYYLMDATLVALPQTEDRLASMEKLGQDSLGTEPLGADQRISFAVSAALLGEADRDRMASDAQTALNEDQNFHGVSPGLQQNLPPAVHTYLDANAALLDLIQTLVKTPERAVSGEQYAAAIQQARTASFNLSQVGMRELDTLLQKRIDDLARLRLIALAWTALALIVSAGIATWVIRSISGTLRTMSEHLLDRSQQIASASIEMAEASRELANGASRQAASLEETSASTEEIRAMAHKNSDHSRAAASLVVESETRIEAANRLLIEMVGSIAGIAEGSNKISRIIKVIDEIAFQTNLLALNAAVEAARAGETGKGFAVVADEVRNLSKRCADAANDTTELIQDSIARAADGRAKVDLVVSAILQVTGDSDKLKALVEEVSLGSEEQTRGIQQMANALVQMDSVTQRNAESAQQSASSVESMKAHADALLVIVNQVTALAGSASGPAPNRSITARSIAVFSR